MYLKWNDIRTCAEQARVYQAVVAADGYGCLNVKVNGKGKETNVSIDLSYGQGASGGVSHVVVARTGKHQYQVVKSTGRNIPGFDSHKLESFGKACIRAVREHRVQGSKWSRV